MKALFRHIKYKASMTEEGSVKIVNFITIGVRGLMLGRGYPAGKISWIDVTLTSVSDVRFTLVFG